MQGVGITGSRGFGFSHVVAIGFVDDHAVDHFENAALDALQFVARPG